MRMQGKTNAIAVPDPKLLQLVTKISTLVSVSVTSSWILVVTIGYFLKFPGLTASIDSIINTCCVILCFEFNEKYYQFACRPCKKSCYFCCYSYHTFVLKRANTDENTLSKMQVEMKKAMNWDKREENESNKNNNDDFEDAKDSIAIATKLKRGRGSLSNAEESYESKDSKDDKDTKREITDHGMYQTKVLSSNRSSQLLGVDIKYEQSQSSTSTKTEQ